MRLQVFYFLLLGLSTGCGGDPRAYYYTTQKPSRADIAGRWIIDKEQTERCGPKVDFEIPAVVFEFMDDGTFTMKNMPDKWCVEHGDIPDKIWREAGTGSWIFKEREGWWRIEANNGKCTNDLMLTGSGPPYSLHYSIGDPDSGLGLVFKRL